MRRLSVVCLLAVLAVPIRAADSYVIDSDYSSIRFSVPYDFMILGQLKGEFREFEGEVLYDAENPAESKISIEIVTSSVDTRFEARDIGLKSQEYLAVETYPLARFDGDVVEMHGPGGVLAGLLTMRGISRQVEVEFELLDLGDTLVVSGTSELSRKAFEVEGPDLTGDIVIGDEVSLELHLTLRKADTEQQ